MGSKLLYSLPALLLAFLALALAIFGISSQPEPAKTAEAAPAQAHSAAAHHYWVATQPMGAGDTLDAVKLARISSPNPIPGALSDNSKVVGQVLEQAVAPGELIREGLFRDDPQVLPSVLPAGRRALAIPVDNVSGIGGLLRPGDVVDVVTAFNRSEDNKGPAALITLQAVPVLAVHGRMTPPDDSNKDQQRSRNNTVVLSVPESQVAALLLASTKGEIRLAMVSNKDAPVAPGTAEAAVEGAPRLAIATTALTPDADGHAVEPDSKPFYYSDFFPEARKAPVKAAPRRPRGHRVQVFEGAETRSTYVR